MYRSKLNEKLQESLAAVLPILAIVLILLALFGKFFGNDRRVYCWTIGLTLLAALYDLLREMAAQG